MNTINILIPMAGEGSRFQSAGYTTPKPLIEIFNKPMIKHAVESLGVKGRYIFITRKEHKVKEYLEEEFPDSIVLEIDYTTRGSAVTCLLAKEYINSEVPLLITNCDQIMHWDSVSFNSFIENYPHDGFVVTYTEFTNKNSYIEIDNYGFGKRIAEKEVISNISLNGIHYWKHGKDFVSSSIQMIENNETYNNEFYVGPTYNTLIRQGKKIGIYHIPNQQHNAVGTPEDLLNYVDKVFNNEGR